VFERPAFVRCRIAYKAIDLPAFMAVRQILCNRHPVFTNEEQAVAVLVDLHFVAGADPPPELGFGFFVLVKVARAERFPEFIDMGC